VTTAADALITRLEALGVEVVFGIPGVDNLAFFEALDRSGLRSILVRNEATAGYAADAHFRVSGRPAACFTTAGPGAANAITAMGEAWASTSAFVHLTTTVATTYGSAGRPRGLPHYHPRQIDMFRPVSKLALHCDDAAELATMGARCIEAMTTPPFAPTYLEVPYDLLSADVSDGAAMQPVIADPALADGARLSVATVRAAASLLRGARRPLIWAGSGCLAAVDDVIRLAERLDAPIVVTHSAKRRFMRIDHPLVVAYPPHEPPVAELIESSDVMLVLGSDLDAMMTRQFALALPGHLVHVDVEPEHIGMSYPAEVSIVAHVSTAVSALLAALGDRDAAQAGRDGSMAAAKARTATVAGLADDGRGEFPGRFLDALDIALPPDAVVVCDMAVAGYWVAGDLALAPRRQLLYPSGWGTLGFALPAAIGASVAAPATRTVCVAGDAGALYAIGELATIAQERLPITLVIVDDAGYGMLRYAARQRFGRTFAVDLVSPDLQAVASAFGLPSWSCAMDDPAMPSAIAAAAHADGPSVVVVSGSLEPPRMALLGTPHKR
jgi:thiamine pyrophosphate-dependent acetolactate synthase large subunit-like protein